MTRGFLRDFQNFVNPLERQFEFEKLIFFRRDFNLVRLFLDHGGDHRFTGGQMLTLRGSDGQGGMGWGVYKPCLCSSVRYYKVNYGNYGNYWNYGNYVVANATTSRLCSSERDIKV